ncbi:class I SAM-dependent methyltransferase [Tessaracoccus rhinocerotis]|uniref:class I SAM-dependent methyltransferase n=1 Tax=Tessaracoccus rhinocerotis TaxID=1689449 RepID=UPI00163D3D93|nr:methyltransferase domain-containing protein [Tessaracoccus rhinocerotis]
MRYILFPGRHHLVTRFQVAHLRDLLARHPGAELVWAITSADHGGTQRNPVPGSRRLGMLEAVAAVEHLPSLTFRIGNRSPKPDFAHYVVESIRTQSGGRVTMTPTNTVVACSTPAVIAGYEALGYGIDTVELGTRQLRPWDVVEAIVAAGPAWRDDEAITAAMDPTSRQHYLRYGLAEHVQQIHADPLIDSDDGDITDTRDYATYRAAFEDNAWRKVSEFAHAVRPGRIVDVGCATGQTIKLLAERPDLFESDFYGVEVARPLYEICRQRQSNGEFGDANVFFHQRNILTTQLFERDSVDTVITMALTHEVWSYLGPEALAEFIRHTFEMLRPGGVWINYDVVGPDDPDREVLVRFTTDDGADAGELAELSSRARFERFAQDFRAEEGERISHQVVHVDGVEHVRLTRRALYEFLAKKDYVDSWLSEAHEAFCFYSPQDWVQVLEAAGFRCTDDTRGVRNPWLLENRFAPAAQVFTVGEDGALVPEEWSWTNVLLVAEKPA